MVRKRSRTLTMVAPAVLAWAVGPGVFLAAAQAARLTVRVVDQSDLILVGARVRVSKTESGEPALPADVLTAASGQAVVSVDMGARYRVSVDYPGFASQTRDDLVIRTENTRVTVKLRLAGITQEVTVRRDPQEERSDPRGSAFKRVLMPEDLAALPEDPESFERALRELAGPGAAIRVDGFRGSRLPPKSAISQVRFTYSDFTAEFHEPTTALVDIETKPGIERFSGSVAFGARSSRLNARDPLAARKPDTSSRTFSGSANGPVLRGRSSFMATLSFTSEQMPQVVRAFTPEGDFSAVVPGSSRNLFAWASFAQSLPAGRALMVRAIDVEAKSTNRGTGGFDLPERSFDASLADRQLLLSLKGAFAGRVFNQTRVRASLVRQARTSRSDEPAVMVLGAFNAGGAQTGGVRRELFASVADDLDLAWKRHALRIGVHLEHVWIESSEWENLGGTLTYASLPDYRAGTPVIFTRRLGDPALRLGTWRSAAYLQDDIRLGKALSLSAGVRVEAQQGMSGGADPAPRLSASWSPSERGTTAVRLGIGRYVDWVPTTAIETARRLDGARQREVRVPAPSLPLPDTGNGVSDVAPTTRYELSPDLRLPDAWRWSAAVDHQLSPAFSITATYLEARQRGVLRGTLRAPAARDSALAIRQVVRSGNEGSRRERRVRLQCWWRPGQRLSLTGTYTAGRVEDDADGAFVVPAAADDLEAEWGPAASDARHRFSATALLRPRAGVFVLLNPWFHSGTPYSVLTGRDDNGDGFVSDRPDGTPRHSARGQAVFLVNASVRWQRELGAVASGPPGESTARPCVLELSLDVQNLLNRTNPAGYVGVITSPFFGMPTAAYPARRLAVRASLRFR